MNVCNTNKYYLVIVLTAFTIFEVSASERWLSGNDLTEEQANLLSKFITYAKANDIKMLKSLYYQPSLTCTQAPNADSIDEYLTQKQIIAKNIPEKYQATISSYDAHRESSNLEKLVGGPLVGYVTTPSHELKVGYSSSRNGGIAYFRIVKNKNEWSFVRECPGPGYSKFEKLQLKSREK